MWSFVSRRLTLRTWNMDLISCYIGSHLALRTGYFLQVCHYLFIYSNDCLGERNTFKDQLALVNRLAHIHGVEICVKGGLGLKVF